VSEATMPGVEGCSRGCCEVSRFDKFDMVEISVEVRLNNCHIVKIYGLNPFTGNDFCAFHIKMAFGDEIHGDFGDMKSASECYSLDPFTVN
jgi:hypothetical protein